MAPPFLASLILFLASLIMVAGGNSDTFVADVFGFVPLLFFSYAFGVGPSCIYALAMELWFRNGLQARCGLIGTIAFSGLLGIGAGFLCVWLGIWSGFLTQPDDLSLARLGFVVGLLTGFYAGKSQ